MPIEFHPDQKKYSNKKKWSVMVKSNLGLERYDSTNQHDSYANNLDYNPNQCNLSVQS